MKQKSIIIGDTEKINTDNFQSYYEEVINAVKNGAFQMADADPNSCYYHYTSLNTLMSVVDNNELWATDAMFLNDEEEFQYVLEILQSALNMRFDYDDIGCIRFRAGFDKYIGDSTEMLKELFGDSYVLCFSTKQDNLTLWSEFANQGCNMELNLWSILESLDDNGHHDFNHGRVIYDAYTQRKIIQDVLEQVLELFFPRCDIHAGKPLWKQIKNLDEKCFDFLIGSCMAIVRYKGMFFKRPEFSAEKEFRLIVHSKDPVQRNHLPIKGMLRPFIKIPVTMDESSLKSVTLAPYNVEVAARSVKDFIQLNDKVKDVPIRKSVIRLRY